MDIIFGSHLSPGRNSSNNITRVPHNRWWNPALSIALTSFSTAVKSTLACKTSCEIKATKERTGLTIKCVASHPEIRMLFLNANIPLFLYPFLKTESKARPFEHLRLSSLGVIGALVKVDDTEVIRFLPKTEEFVPLCFSCMEMHSELSRTVATFIVQKILLDDLGLRHMCALPERLFSVSSLLASMVRSHPLQPRLLKHIIRCFLRLSDNPRACAALQTLLPDELKDGTVDSCLVDEPAAGRWLQLLLHNVTVKAVGGAPQPCLDHMTRI